VRCNGESQAACFALDEHMDRSWILELLRKACSTSLYEVAWILVLEEWEASTGRGDCWLETRWRLLGSEGWDR